MGQNPLPHLPIQVSQNFLAPHPDKMAYHMTPFPKSFQLTHIQASAYLQSLFCTTGTVKRGLEAVSLPPEERSTKPFFPPPPVCDSRAGFFYTFPSKPQISKSTNQIAKIKCSILSTFMAAITDPTFRSYSAEEAKLYAASRLSYSQNTYNKVLDHHTATGGKFDLLLDVGCGPGNATRDLALSFDRTIGADPGAQMIEAANALGGKTKSGKAIEFVVAPAEEISQIKHLGPSSVDLLTAAMAVSCVERLQICAEFSRLIGLT
jgi:hypothetical protein